MTDLIFVNLIISISIRKNLSENLSESQQTVNSKHIKGRSFQRSKKTKC